MVFSIQWNDVKELADNDVFVNKCSLELVGEHENNLKNVGDNDGEKNDFQCSTQFSFDESQHLSQKINHVFIHGDNYPCLKLLEKEYKEKVDFIYIDPPYNTGKTNFIYNDSRFLGKKNHFLPEDRHSSWLSFMQRRLLAAKKLLSQSGCIFIAIGKEELYQLKILCDSIFGEENFVNDFMWLHGKGKKDAWSRTLEESNLCYAKNKKKLLPFEDYEQTDWATENADQDERGNWFSGSVSFSEERSSKNHPNYYEIVSPSGKKWQRQWFFSKDEMESLISRKMIYFGKAPDFSNVPRRKIFNGEKNKIIPKNIIEFAESTRQAQAHVDEILGEKKSFDNPKSVSLIEHFIKISCMKKNAIIMDFFAGSGTTFEAAILQNQKDGGKRKCILIQEPAPVNREKSKFKTISQLCLNRMCSVLGKNDRILEYKLKQPGDFQD